jgi:hypothetical protein
LTWVLGMMRNSWSHALNVVIAVMSSSMSVSVRSGLSTNGELSRRLASRLQICMSAPTITIPEQNNQTVWIQKSVDTKDSKGNIPGVCIWTASVYSLIHGGRAWQHVCRNRHSYQSLWLLFEGKGANPDRRTGHSDFQAARNLPFYTIRNHVLLMLHQHVLVKPFG